MACEDFTKSVAGTEGFDFCIGAAPLKVFGDFLHRHAVEVQEGEKRLVFGGKLGKEGAGFIEGEAGVFIFGIGEEWPGVGEIDGGGEGRAFLAAAVFQTGADSDAFEPVEERSVGPPVGKGLPRFDESFLNEIFEIGMGSGEPVKDGGDERLMFEDDGIESIEIAGLGELDEFEVRIGGFRGVWRGHGKIAPAATGLGKPPGDWQITGRNRVSFRSTNRIRAGLFRIFPIALG